MNVNDADVTLRELVAPEASCGPPAGLVVRSKDAGKRGRRPHPVSGILSTSADSPRGVFVGGQRNHFVDETGRIPQFNVGDFIHRPPFRRVGGSKRRQYHPTVAFTALVKGFEGECPCCQRLSAVIGAVVGAIVGVGIAGLFMRPEEAVVLLTGVQLGGPFGLLIGLALGLMATFRRSQRRNE